METQHYLYNLTLQSLQKSKRVSKYRMSTLPHRHAIFLSAHSLSYKIHFAINNNQKLRIRFGVTTHTFVSAFG